MVCGDLGDVEEGLGGLGFGVAFGGAFGDGVELAEEAVGSWKRPAVK